MKRCLIMLVLALNGCAFALPDMHIPRNLNLDGHTVTNASDVVLTDGTSVADLGASIGSLGSAAYSNSTAFATAAQGALAEAALPSVLNSASGLDCNGHPFSVINAYAISFAAVNGSSFLSDLSLAGNALKNVADPAGLYANEMVGDCQFNDERYLQLGGSITNLTGFGNAVFADTNELVAGIVWEESSVSGIAVEDIPAQFSGDLALINVPTAFEDAVLVEDFDDDLWVNTVDGELALNAPSIVIDSQYAVFGGSSFNGSTGAGTGVIYGATEDWIMDETTPFSVSFWCHTVSQYSLGAATDMFSLYDSAGTLVLRLYTLTGDTVLTYSSIFSTISNTGYSDAWHYWSINYDGDGTLRIYVDGASFGSTTAGENTFSVTSDSPSSTVNSMTINHAINPLKAPDAWVDDFVFKVGNYEALPPEQPTYAFGSVVPSPSLASSGVSAAAVETALSTVADNTTAIESLRTGQTTTNTFYGTTADGTGIVTNRWIFDRGRLQSTLINGVEQ